MFTSTFSKQTSIRSLTCVGFPLPFNKPPLSWERHVQVAVSHITPCIIWLELGQKPSPVLSLPSLYRAQTTYSLLLCASRATKHQEPIASAGCTGFNRWPLVVLCAGACIIHVEKFESRLRLEGASDLVVQLRGLRRQTGPQH